MLQPSHDWHDLCVNEDSFPVLEPDRDWMAIAQELVNESDPKKVQELSQQLVDALHKRRQGTS